MVNDLISGYLLHNTYIYCLKALELKALMPFSSTPNQYIFGCSLTVPLKLRNIYGNLLAQMSAFHTVCAAFGGFAAVDESLFLMILEDSKPLQLSKAGVV